MQKLVLTALAVVAVTLIACRIVKQSPSSPSPSSPSPSSPSPSNAGPFQTDPVRTLGHGAFVGMDGEAFVPDVDFIVGAQAYYMTDLLIRLESDALESRFRTLEKEAHRLSDDPVLVNALLMDWLLEQYGVRPPGQLAVVHHALRWHYVLNLSPDKLVPDARGRWAKGFDLDVARLLENLGLPVFLSTNAGGADYRVECRSAGVPVPDRVMSDAWENRGEFTNEFLSPGLEAELWLWVSEDPEGVCLALPRYDGDRITLLGVICLGTDSSKACFFDNPRGSNWKRGDVRGIEEFVGGNDLVANGQGVCGDCHAGENPYVVHPDKAAFAGLTDLLRPDAWHDPLLPPSWPQNPGPTNLLDAVPSPGKCTTCHSETFAGRFPEVSSQLPGYCSVVLGSATGGSTRTMPPGGGSISNYQAHVDALKNACGNPPGGGGVVVPVDPDDFKDDDSHISPPQVIDPLYRCATQVAVRGAILDAEVELFIDDVLAGTIAPARSPEEIIFAGLPALGVGQRVKARQKLAGLTSAFSPVVVVRDHTLDYPAGLPAPELDPTLVYECANLIAVRHVPGAKLTVFVNGADPASRSTATDWSQIRPGVTPFSVGDVLTAQISLCDDVSPLSAPITVVAAPPSVLDGVTLDPPQVHEGQELLLLRDLANGSRRIVIESANGQIAKVENPVWWHWDIDVVPGLGRPLTTSDQLAFVEELCDETFQTGPIPVQPCRELPAPAIAHPVAGQDWVLVTDSVPGARVRVFDASGIELGDGSGDVIWLNRAITAADVLTVVQQVGDCVSDEGYRISVRNPK